MVAMNPQAAPARSIIPVKVTMLVQVLVCLGIVASTISITRSVVQSNTAKLNANLAHLRSPSGVSLQEKSNSTPTANITAATDFDYTKLHGYIVSNKERRYNHSRTVLVKLGMVSHQYVPLSYKSDAIQKAIDEYRAANPKQRSEKFKKVLSNRMAFTYLFQQFVEDTRAALDSWRFFFEDDVALHPSLTESLAHKVLAGGLELAERDGIVYLGICGPRNCKKKALLASSVEAKQCAGACTHAFGMTKWKTRSFLANMGKLNVSSLYFDQVLRTFGEKVHTIWVLGSNLKSPQAKNHYGLVFQDRRSYPSIIDAREPLH